MEELNDLGRPPGVANRLHRYRWEPGSSGCKILALPSFFARLFVRLLGDIPSVAGVKWRREQADDTSTSCLESLTPLEESRVEEFLDFFSRAVVLGPNEFIHQAFDAELTLAIALDYNFLDREHRTPLGQLEFRAKWQQSLDATQILARHLVSASRWLPIEASGPAVCLMGVPQHTHTPFRLPRALAEAMAITEDQTQKNRSSFELLEARLTCRKPGLKELSLEQKLACWDDLVKTEKVTLSGPVEGRTILVIDDLYQSGVTMWSMARYLKQQGAAAVFGLACVKSIRDTDNL